MHAYPHVHADVYARVCLPVHAHVYPHVSYTHVHAREQDGGRRGRGMGAARTSQPGSLPVSQPQMCQTPL